MERIKLSGVQIDQSFLQLSHTNEFKPSQLYLGRVALSAIGSCVNYDYLIKLKITLKLCTRILKSA